MILLLWNRKERKAKKVLKVQQEINETNYFTEQRSKYQQYIISILKVQDKGTGSFCFIFALAHHVPVDVLIEPFHVLYRYRVMSTHITSLSRHFLHPHHQRKERERNGKAGWEKR